MSIGIKVLRKVISKQCTNYFPEHNGIKNFCVNIDKSCKFFNGIDCMPRCKYLEESILPVEQNKAMSTMYYTVIKAQSTGDNLNSAIVKSILQKENNRNLIECKKCRLKIKANSNRQKYCDRCKKIICREQARLRMQNQRKVIGV